MLGLCVKVLMYRDASGLEVFGVKDLDTARRDMCFRMKLIHVIFDPTQIKPLATVLIIARLWMEDAGLPGLIIVMEIASHSLVQDIAIAIALQRFLVALLQQEYLITYASLMGLG